MSTVKITTKGILAYIEIDGVRVKDAIAYTYEHEAGHTPKVTVTVLAEDVTLELDGANVAVEESSGKLTPDGYLDATRLMDTTRRWRKNGLNK